MQDRKSREKNSLALWYQNSSFMACVSSGKPSLTLETEMHKQVKQIGLVFGTYHFNNYLVPKAPHNGDRVKLRFFFWGLMKSIYGFLSDSEIKGCILIEFISALCSSRRICKKMWWFAICNSHYTGVPLEHKQHNEKLTWEVVYVWIFASSFSASSHAFMLILSKVEMGEIPYAKV